MRGSYGQRRPRAQGRSGKTHCHTTGDGPAHSRGPGQGRRPHGRFARFPHLPAASTSLLSSAILLLAFVLIMALPAGTADDPAHEPSALSVPLQGISFQGTPAVGALFVAGSAGQASHFCTGTVVDSPNHDLVITAAHCLDAYARNVQTVTFVPGYHDGKAPYGVWSTQRVIVDQAWESSGDPDDDVAFLVVSGRGSTRVEDVTGAERLATGEQPTGVIEVIGYPSAQERPVSCQNRTIMISATQLRFDCGGFTQGTSGGPFIADISPATGTGTVVGVIGGYQEGGYTAEISYSPAFRDNVAVLYRSAVAAS